MRLIDLPQYVCSTLNYGEKCCSCLRTHCALFCRWQLWFFLESLASLIRLDMLTEIIF